MAAETMPDERAEAPETWSAADWEACWGFAD